MQKPENQNLVFGRIGALILSFLIAIIYTILRKIKM